MTYPKKSLGQNFLHDKNVINKIINLKDIQNRNVLEIGPGTGNLTNEILNRKPKTLTLIEKDSSLTKILNKKFMNYKFVKIISKDFMKVELDKILKEKTIIFGNLPYNLSSQILVKLIKDVTWPPKFSDLILMFQKEVADKIIGKSYGRLSILANFRLNFLKSFEVSPNCFNPKPKVISKIIHLVPNLRKNLIIKKIANLELVTNILFSNRRKMINKNIHKILDKNQIKHLKLNTSKRPENIDPEMFYKITNLFEKEKKFYD